MSRNFLSLAGLSISFLAVGCEQPPPAIPTKAVVAPNGTEPPPATPKSAIANPAAAASLPAEESTAAKTAERSDVPEDLLGLFKQLDELGRARVKDARFVKVTLTYPEAPEKEFSEDGWLLEEDDSTVTLLKDDLIPRIYLKKSVTTVPASWRPSVVQLKSVSAADFESLCRTMSEPEPEPADETEQRRRLSRTFHDPGPSHRLLVAHAAWKQGLSQYSARIVALDPMFSKDPGAYRKAVMDDLGWLHFLRGVNLLMFADRKEVLTHLKIASHLSWKSELGTDVDGLIPQIERLVATPELPETQEVDEASMAPAERAKLYISQLKDLQGRQWGQPGGVSIYYSLEGGEDSKPLPPQKLVELGIPAIPFLIKALEDDTPTRTISHWRDFHRSRDVLRVSDVAASILAKLTAGYFVTQFPMKKGQYHTAVSFSEARPEVRKAAIDRMQRWYDENKDLSPADRMFGLFSGNNPDNWITAGRYFLDRKDNRAVAPLLEKLAQPLPFRQGELCELVARFGDPAAVPVILNVLKTAKEASDRVKAVNALWDLGDDTGVLVAIEYVSAAKQPYGRWGDPIWFLVKSHTPDGIDALTAIVTDGPLERAAEVLGHIKAAVTGEFRGSDRPRTGSVEVCPLLLAAMDREELTGGSINDIKTRFKDCAAYAFAALRQGPDDPEYDRVFNIDPKLFNELEPDEAKRDEQIEALKKWYGENKQKVIWDSKARKLAVKVAE